MFDVQAILERRFRFLNLEKQFHEKMTWVNPEFNYLWDFNLHYFEYLYALVDLSNTNKREALAASLVDAWIGDNPCPSRPAWHPYPISLRIINWIKTFTSCPDLAVASRQQSLYTQALYLERNLEGHLMVNHFLENGRALLFAGLYFDGTDADRWATLGRSIVEEELNQEVLPKGGHFERSPMYHAILIEGLLDIYAYLAAQEYETDWLKGPLLQMCTWLEAIQTPDGWYPLFNDSALGISANVDDILINAERIIGWQHQSILASVRDCDGYFVLDKGSFTCFIDGAPIGPSYNPGHAHADNLSFEIFYKGSRLVVDPGIYSYVPGRSRSWFRSTASHNTVVINELEQSEMWGGFRVGRRSNPQFARAGQIEGLLVFHGAYDNRVAPTQKIKHERILIVCPEKYILVWDILSARNEIRAKSYCQFAPAWTLSEDRLDKGFSLTHTDGDVMNCAPLGNVIKQSRLRGFYSPEFGNCLPVERVCFEATNNKHLSFGFIIGALPINQLNTTSVTMDGDILSMVFNNEKFIISLKDLDT